MAKLLILWAIATLISLKAVQGEARIETDYA
jgi:hypothetical protein